jgi:uncharacterized protein with PIN domain
MFNVSFQFFGELTNFLAEPNKQLINYSTEQSYAIKDTIEALGVPHTEPSWIFVNDKLVDFSYRIQPNDQVKVYPAHIQQDAPLCLRPARQNYRFMVDANVRAVAKYLRLLGFYTVTDDNLPDEKIAKLAAEKDYIILTRDIGLLKRKNVVHGCFLHSEDTETQLQAVVERYQLKPYIKAFSLCLVCNGEIQLIDKQFIAQKVPTDVYETLDEFYTCPDCERVYWKGSHYDKLQHKLKAWT